VEVYPGFGGKEVLYDWHGAVAGVATGAPALRCAVCVRDRERWACAVDVSRMHARSTPHTHMHTHAHTCTGTCTHTRTHTHTHTQSTHKAHTHTRTHTRAPPGDMGVAKDGSHKATFAPGVDLLAPLTLFGEGCRGSLSEVRVCACVVVRVRGCACVWCGVCVWCVVCVCGVCVVCVWCVWCAGVILWLEGCVARLLLMRPRESRHRTQHAQHTHTHTRTHTRTHAHACAARA
jgi:hypothetical protein